MNVFIYVYAYYYKQREDLVKRKQVCLMVLTVLSRRSRNQYRVYDVCVGRDTVVISVLMEVACNVKIVNKNRKKEIFERDIK